MNSRRCNMKFARTAFVSLAVVSCAFGAFPDAPAQSANNQKTKFMSELMQNAKTIRRLEDANGDDAYVRDLSDYAFRFDKCQFIQAFDDELSANGNADTVLSTKSYVTFQICPSATCSNSYASGCGEYVMDMVTYLYYAGTYYSNEIANTCNTCDANCEVDDVYGYDKYANYNGNRRLDFERKLDGNNCSSCLPMCYLYENFGGNGYVDALDYTECVAADVNDEGTQLYVGPSCVSNGHKIKMAVFEDEYCSVSYDMSVDKLLGVHVSDLVLSKLSSKKCVDCSASNDDAYGDQVDLCSNVYSSAAKCEVDMDDSELSGNAALNEQSVCNFIQIIESGTYDQSGQIYTNDGAVSRVSGGIDASGPQKFFLTAFLLASCALGVYAYVLFGLVRRRTNKVSLSSQDGTLA